MVSYKNLYSLSFILKNEFMDAYVDTYQLPILMQTHNQSVGLTLPTQYLISLQP